VRGRLARVVDRGALVRVDVEGGLTTVALIPRQAFRASGLAVGDEVTASFDPGAAHVFPAS